MASARFWSLVLLLIGHPGDTAMGNFAFLCTKRSLIIVRGHGDKGGKMFVVIMNSKICFRVIIRTTNRYFSSMADRVVQNKTTQNRLMITLLCPPERSEASVARRCIAKPTVPQRCPPGVCQRCTVHMWAAFARTSTCSWCGGGGCGSGGRQVPPWASLKQGEPSGELSSGLVC